MNTMFGMSDRSHKKDQPSELRWGVRRPSPRLAVYYWDGGTPQPRAIRDISQSGVFLLTQEPLFPGVVLMLTMQRKDLEESSPDQWIAVHALVVRRDPEGVALSFVFPKDRATRLRSTDLANGATREEMTVFLAKLFQADLSPIPWPVQNPDPAPAHLGAEATPAVTRPSRLAPSSNTSKACICNLTRHGLVNSDVNVINTVKEPLKTITDHLSHISDAGLWLAPFRGLPFGKDLARFDVIFLDDNYRIAECAEQFAVAESASFRGKHASAIVVPSHTIASAQIKVGDQLKICTPASRATAMTDARNAIAASTARSAASSQKQLQCFRDAAASTAKPSAEAMVAPARKPRPIHASESTDWNSPAKKTRFLQWLFPGSKTNDRRLAPRIPSPEIIAFHATGGQPKSHRIGDVSGSGFYLLTDERWLPGTRIAMTFQKTGCAENETDWSRVESEVVRWGDDGVGFRFAMENTEILQGNESERRAFQHFIAGVTAPQPGAPPIVH